MTNADVPSLEQIGLKLVDPDASPEVYAELLRVARRIRESHRRTIGLLPASPRVAVPAVAIQLAAVLADVCIGDIAFVDANTRWPALAALAPQAAQPQPVRVQLCDHVVAFSRSGTDGRIDTEWLERTLRVDAGSFVHALVDLTGFPAMGEHAHAFDIVDGVLIVARAGLTREAELLARDAEVPRSRKLGVLLSG